MNIVSRKVAHLSSVTFVYADSQTRALDEISLDIPQGQWVALVGANGSGKSTLGRVLAGLVSPDSGIVNLCGHTVFSDNADSDASDSAQPGVNPEAYRAARKHIGIVFQNPEDQIVTTIVESDVAFGPENLGVEPFKITQRVHNALAQVNLQNHAQDDPLSLSGGQQQREAIASALAMNPSMLILDEPTSMIDPAGRSQIMEAIEQAHAQGTTIVHITHFSSEAAQAERIIEMEHGVIIADSTQAEYVLSHSDELSQATQTLITRENLVNAGIPVSHFAQEPIATSTNSSAHLALDLRNISYSFENKQRGIPDKQVLSNFSMNVAPGEFVAIAGENGTGKSTLSTIMTALTRPQSGEVLINGIESTDKAHHMDIRQSVGYVMQHPERQLFATTVREDVAFGPQNFGLSADEADKRALETLKMLGIENLADRVPWELSGGQQRLVAIAGVLAFNPQILVVDEPTASLDSDAQNRIMHILDYLHSQGHTIVMVTHSFDRITTHATRAIILGKTDSDAQSGEMSKTNDSSKSRSRKADSTGSSQPAHIPTPLFAKLDPRVLTIGTVALMISIFAISNAPQLCLSLALIIAFTAASGLTAKTLFKRAHGFIAVFIVMALFNVLFVQKGSELFHIGFVRITDVGVWDGVLYAARLAIVMILGIDVVNVLTPTVITDACESLLSPLRRLGAHVHEVALTMSLALRFVPILSRECIQLLKAQASRGGEVERGSAYNRLRAIGSLVVPVLAGTIRHATNVGVALEARSYEGGDGRTKWHAMRSTWRDAIAAACVILWFVGLIMLGIFF